MKQQSVIFASKIIIEEEMKRRGFALTKKKILIFKNALIFLPYIAFGGILLLMLMFYIKFMFGIRTETTNICTKS